MKIKKTPGEKAFVALSYFVVTCLTILCFYPFWHVLCASLSDANALYRHTGLLFWPVGFSLEAYETILNYDLLWSGLKNVAILELTSVPLNLLLTALCAYVLSRPNLYFKKFFALMCILTMYFDGGMIPTYLNFQQLGLTNMLGVVLGFSFGAYNMIILRTSFQSIPSSIYDAARIDGAGHLRVLWDVVLPLSKASLAVIAMYVGIGNWNGWFWSSMLIREETGWPLQAVLRKLLLQSDAGVAGSGERLYAETIKYAIIIISVVPILMIYPWIQKHFTKGVLVGSVKE